MFTSPESYNNNAIFTSSTLILLCSASAWQSSLCSLSFSIFFSSSSLIWFSYEEQSNTHQNTSKSYGWWRDSDSDGDGDGDKVMWWCGDEDDNNDELVCNIWHRWQN